VAFAVAFAVAADADADEAVTLAFAVPLAVPFDAFMSAVSQHQPHPPTRFSPTAFALAPRPTPYTGKRRQQPLREQEKPAFSYPEHKKTAPPDSPAGRLRPEGRVA
jgi:hypothetical protein